MNFHFEIKDKAKLPLVATSAQPPLRDLNHVGALLRAARMEISDALLKHGAILFRDLPLQTAEDFASIVPAFGGEAMNYVGGTVPRTVAGAGIFTSTELDARFCIQLHNELAYQPQFPSRILFFCERPAPHGGQTTLADSRSVLAALDPEIRSRFEKLGVRYVRVFQNHVPSRERLKRHFPLYYHPTWKSAFGSGSRDVVEERCRALQVAFRWRENGDLETSNWTASTIQHPVTGEISWFNHANNLHFNPRSLGKPTYYWRRLRYRSIADHPNQVYFGDGQTIRDAEIDRVHAALDECTVAVQWRKGDLLLVDNRLAAHGRLPFSGDRRVLVSLLRDRD